MSDFTIKQGMTQPVLEDQITMEDGTHPDLTGSTVDISVLLEGSASWTARAEVTDGPSASLLFQFNETQTAEYGEGLWNWAIKFPDGSSVSFPTKGYNTITIEPNLVKGRPIAYAPSTREVAVLLMARTADEFGKPTGDFSSHTSVTHDQASSAIEDAVEEVAEAIGTEVPADKVRSAKRLVRTLAAANIEMSYFPEQAAATNSMYDKLMTRYNAQIRSLEESVGEEEIADNVESGGVSGRFPPSNRWGSRRW